MISADRLPPLLSSHTDGYMPLYCAAKWIATKGATSDFDHDELAAWQPVYTELLASIVSEKIRVVGNRDNAQEVVAGHHFVGCAIQYPHHTVDFDLAIGNDLWLLQSYAYEDENDWRDGFSDALVDRQGKGWSRLMVRKSEVAELWQFGISPPAPTGAPGRPSSMHLVIMEFESRASRNDIEQTATEQAQVLADWLKQKHPTQPKLTRKTIRNNIGQKYRQLKGPKL